MKSSHKKRRLVLARKQWGKYNQTAKAPTNSFLNVYKISSYIVDNVDYCSNLIELAKDTNNHKITLLKRMKEIDIKLY